MMQRDPAIRTLDPCSLRTLYADSADICTLIWSADRVRRLAEAVRREHGASTE